MLELKSGARVQTAIVDFFALPFPFSKRLKNLVISSRSRGGTTKKCTKNRDARAELLFC